MASTRSGRKHSKPVAGRFAGVRLRSTPVNSFMAFLTPLAVVFLGLFHILLRPFISRRYFTGVLVTLVNGYIAHIELE